MLAVKHAIALAIGLGLGLAYHFGSIYRNALLDVRRAMEIHLDSHEERAHHAPNPVHHDPEEEG